MLLSVSDCLSHVPDMSNETLSRTELLTMLENLRCIIPFPHGRDAMLKTYEFNPLHPWAASMLYGRARSMLLDYVCELEEREPFIYMAAYLYAAVDQGLLLGKERLFYGKDPGSMSDVYKSFMLQMGMSGVDMKLRLAPPNGREAAIWHGMTARVRARVERDGPVFSMAPLVDCALSPAFKEFMQRFSSATMSDKDVAEHLHHLGDCIVQVPGADDMSNKHQLKSLGRSDYLKVIQSELRQHQPMYIKAFSPHMSQLLPGFPSFLIGSDDFKMQVSLFITVLSSPDGQGAAYHIARAIKVYKEKAAERRPVIQGILKKIRGYVREMMVADDVKRDI
ncbi:hypothetical protein BCR44DRAFT_1425677 [Catenaria anguillulae PL171]|uniref:Uncharacterized protein n=1 Tax=Catenaria anguillulae PL171 TaxID=765915 RepID=A0A1Y2HYV1_9FUNG|nr:hypothetical protein BCR44DRAFT_1425677 [Catenaria anguillulae PL171]